MIWSIVMSFFSVLGSIMYLLFVVLSFSQQVMAITLPERCISPTSPLRNLTHLSALSTTTPINNNNIENHYLTLIFQYRGEPASAIGDADAGIRSSNRRSPRGMRAGGGSYAE